MTRADSVHSPRGECSLADLSDDALVTHVAMLVQKERRATTDLIVALREFDRRKLYLGQGCSSLFTYCTQVLHLSEHAAFNRIEAARISSRFPAVIEGLQSGWLTLTAVRVLSPVLTPENHARLLREAKYKSKRDVECLVAAERPQPDAPDRVRKHAGLPVHATPAIEQLREQLSDINAPVPIAAEARETRASPAVISPLAVERYRIQFTASKAVEGKLRRAQALLRHAIPGGQIEAVIERALDLLLATLEKQKGAGTRHARSRPGLTATGSRHIPAAVKREVWRRDAGRCAFVGTVGRCTEEAFLEFHHVIPFADGGAATTANIELRCRAHNAYEAHQYFRLLPRPDD